MVAQQKGSTVALHEVWNHEVPTIANPTATMAIGRNIFIIKTYFNTCTVSLWIFTQFANKWPLPTSFAELKKNNTQILPSLFAALASTFNDTLPGIGKYMSGSDIWFRPVLKVRNPLDLHTCVFLASPTVPIEVSISSLKKGHGRHLLNVQKPFTY